MATLILPCQKSTLEDEPSTSLSWSQSISTSQLGIASIYVSSKFKEIFTLYSWHHCCSVAKLCLTLCDHVNCSRPGSPVLHYLLEFAQIHVHWVSDAIQPSHPLPPPSPPAFHLESSVLWFTFFPLQCLTVPHEMRDLSSPTGDWTHTPCIGRQSLNHWTSSNMSL